MRFPSFTTLSQALGSRFTRRSGIAATLAGFAAALADNLADARVQIPPTCGGTGMQCASGADCCSGRCLAKPDGTSRCARTTSGRKHDRGHRTNRVDPPAPQCSICPVGCQWSSIEAAVEAANAPDFLWPNPYFTIYQGRYAPVRRDRTGTATMTIRKSMSFHPCLENTGPVVIDAAARGQGDYLFAIAAADEHGRCLDDPITVEFDRLVIKGGAHRGFLSTTCDASWTIVDSDVSGFTNERPTLNITNGGSALINNSTIHENRSEQDRGSVIHVDMPSDATLEIRDAQIYENESHAPEDDRGVIGTLSGSITLTGITVVAFNNSTYTAAANGGAFWIGADGSLTIGEGVRIHHNQIGDGAGIYAFGPVTGYTTSTVYDNLSLNSCNNYYDASTATCFGN